VDVIMQVENSMAQTMTKRLRRTMEIPPRSSALLSQFSYFAAWRMACAKVY